VPLPMLKREIPHHAKEGRVIRVSRSHIAPAPLTGENKPGDDWIDGRQWLSELPASWFSLLSTALQVGAWLENHRFCGRCGEKATKLEAEFAMHCYACGHRNYPRISPCIITLVTSGEAMLLARSLSRRKRPCIERYLKRWACMWTNCVTTIVRIR